MNNASNQLAFLPHRGGVLVVFILTCFSFSVSDAQMQPADIPSSTESSQSKIDLKIKKEEAKAGTPEQEGEDARRSSFVAAPIPTSSPATGTGVTLMAGYIFPLRKSDKISPVSVIGAAGLLTDNGTRALAGGTELYFRQDRYHVLTGFAHGDLNYDFYGTGTDAGNAGRKFGVNQTGNIFFVEG